MDQCGEASAASKLASLSLQDRSLFSAKVEIYKFIYKYKNSTFRLDKGKVVLELRVKRRNILNLPLKAPRPIGRKNFKKISQLSILIKDSKALLRDPKQVLAVKPLRNG